MKNITTRAEFLKGVIRVLIVSVLALLVFSLGTKIVTGTGCSECPVKGICDGKRDCSKFKLDEE